MRNKADKMIINVVSRKGGVGKTTAALNCARQFLPKNPTSAGNNILFLDLDITGTEAAEFAHVPMWGTNVHVIKQIDDKKKYINLVEMFESYMTGHPVADACLNDDIYSDKIILKKNCINVFSSLLDKTVTDNHRYGPEVLFDELHSAWFVEMLQRLINSCFSAMPQFEKIGGRRRRRRNIVILDNAPGYSGLQPAIERWLTDLGPQCGKFIFVCSLDPQDFSGTIRTMAQTHKLYTSKITAALAYHNETRPDKKNACQNKFFQLLADTEPGEFDKCTYPARELPNGNHTCNDCGLCFFRQKDIAKIKSEENSSPVRYISLILNKVPPPIRNNSMPYNVKHVLEDLGCEKTTEIVTLETMSEYIDKNPVLETPGLGKIFAGIEKRTIALDPDWSMIHLRHLLGK